MKNVQIYTAASWESVTNLLGSFSSPLLLNTKIVNNNTTPIKIKHICISIKNFIFNDEILGANKDELINPNLHFEFNLDVNHILTYYSQNKKFTVKITFENGEVLESNKISVKMLNNAKLKYN